jgi:hypothetical protein
MWLQWLGRILPVSAKDNRTRTGQSGITPAARGVDENADPGPARHLEQNTPIPQVENVHADG